MPIYVYEILDDRGEPVGEFEWPQGFADDPLTAHPETGQRVRRVVRAVRVMGGKWTDAAMKRGVSDDKKLERLGFTKYVKTGDGKYEKTVGKGPDKIGAGEE